MRDTIWRLAQAQRTTMTNALGGLRQVSAAALTAHLLAVGPAPTGPRVLNLTDALIVGSLDLAFHQIDVSIEFVNCAFTESIGLFRARLPNLSLADCRIMNVAGPSIIADGLTIDGDLFLTGLRASGSGEQGIILISRANIGGQLDLSGSHLTNFSGPALVAENANVRRHLGLTGSFSAIGVSSTGTVRLGGSHIAGDLNLRGARLTNLAGPALAGDDLAVDGQVAAASLFASGVGDLGAVRFANARFDGQLELDSARLENRDGSAFYADGIVVRKKVIMRMGFTANGGAAELGAVHLSGGIIGGDLKIDDARIQNPRGPALTGDRLTVEGNLQLLDGFDATGKCAAGTVRLVGAHVRGQVVIGGELGHGDVTIANTNGPALHADGVKVDGALMLAHRLTLTGEPVAAYLDQASVGTLRLDPAMFSPTNMISPFGLTYVGLPGGGKIGVWLAMLANATPDHFPHAYQELADGCRQFGYGDQRVVVQMTERDEYRRRVLKPEIVKARGLTKVRLRGSALWLFVKKVLIGYGYRPARSWLWLIGVVAASVILAWCAAHTGVGHTDNYAAYRPAHIGEKARACSAGEQIGLGLRVGIPIAGNATDGGCEIDTAHLTGEIYAGVGDMMQGVAWLAATIAVAGYTGIIKRD